MNMQLPLVAGHRLNGQVFEFPHRCPGEDCAVAEWLFRHSVQNAYYRKLAATDLVIASEAGSVLQLRPSDG
jgi:hypothetical protein